MVRIGEGGGWALGEGSSKYILPPGASAGLHFSRALLVAVKAWALLFILLPLPIPNTQFLE